MFNLSQKKSVTILRFLYPIWALIGLFSLMFVSSKLVVESASATAGNILANGLLFRLGIAGSLITQLIFVAVVLVLYQLFKSVDKNYSLLMVVLALVSVPIAMFNELNKLAALQLLNNPDQMMFFLNLNALGIIIASIFWGLWLFPLAVLIYKSGYFPKIIGVLMAIAGFGYFIGSFIHLLFPNLETILLIFEILVYGELLFMIWILFKGAKIPSKSGIK